MSILLAVIAWIGNLFIVAGLWGVGSKNRGAFLFSVVGETAYIARSYFLHDWALLAICCVFWAMALRGYILWGRQ